MSNEMGLMILRGIDKLGIPFSDMKQFFVWFFQCWICCGWGHGVGLCQIGAAVMGDKGYSYDQILSHYFRGAGLDKKY
jgi:hypothetical protein